jgi:hypothetical protein
MSSGAYTKERDKGFKHIVKQLRIADNAKVSIGFRGDKTHDESNTRIVDIATYNEYGTDTIPARPFLSGNHDEKRKQYQADIKKRFSAILTGSTVAQELSQFGEFVVGDVKMFITNLDTPPNAPYTIEKKRGADNPLIDTGTMRNAVKKYVDLKGKK